ncbi:CapA family protein [Uliginosibacterium paludis]|uniref:CapA family protein n=1 Tax=Uliginosibacterium paludis TaxID=1615952 RepID=A0ABV2CUC0_9RHOO
MKILLLTLLCLALPVRAADTVTLLFAGDLMLADGPGRLIAQGGDPLAAVDHLLRDADYRIGNLETSVASVGKAHPNKIYSFRAEPDSLRVLKGRFDAVALANNHSGDFGHEAFLQTMSLLDAAGIRHFGGGRNLDEAHRPLWIELKGLKIALLAYNEYKPRSFAAGPDWPGSAWSEDSRVLADIRAAKSAGADLVIPFMHWGWERERLAGARQRQLARLMIEAGADAVVGGHPHVTQDIEYIHGKPVIYSLGNFVFDGFDTEAETTGWLLRLTLDRQGVLHWDTRAARMDADGSPHPLPGPSPCGQRGDTRPGMC